MTGRATVPRRALLLGAAGLGVGATAGCVQRARSLVNRNTPDPISLSIKTVPADTDPAAIKIARLAASNLEAAGIETEVVPMVEEELLRDVLINHDFDAYVAQYSGRGDPDALRPFVHSVFDDEPGWQNPFGFSDMSVDGLLNRQRRQSGAERLASVADLQRAIAREQPFVVVAFPDEIRTVRTDRVVGWSATGLDSPLGYLGLSPRPDADERADGTLTVAVTNKRVTRNLNPVAVEFRNRGTFTGLLYDSLGRRYGGAVRPWLAESWTWGRDGGTNPAATVRLRPDLRWHDGQPLTAADVAFTYRFLADTKLGRREPPVPAPRFRGRTSLVDAARAIDDRTVQLAFPETHRSVAARALTVPVLPKHEWESRSESSGVAGLDLFEGVTQALVWPNTEPVGSGPLRFEGRIADERLAFERFDDHFLVRGSGSEPADQFGTVPFGKLVVRVAPSDAAAVELVAVGEADATAASLASAVVPRIGRNPDLHLRVGRSESFYHLGFNARRDPLGNPHFRRVVAGLIDKQYVADGIRGGYATPAATPLDDTPWVPADLRWEGRDPEVPFLGQAGTGEPDVAAARTSFREAGYEYGDGDHLLKR